MPDFGIGEALAAFGGADILGGLFGGGEAAAGALGAGEAAAGEGALGGLFGGAEAGAGALGEAGAAAGAGLGADALGFAAPAGLDASTGGLGVIGGAFPLDTGAAVGEAGQAVNFGAIGTPSVGAGAFAPAPGVALPGGIAPDLTSAAAFDPTSLYGESTGLTTFNSAAQPTVDAVSSGAFDPVGSGYTTFQGTPGTAPGGGLGGPDGATALAGGTNAPPTSAGASGFDVSGNPIDPATGSSNPQYPGGATAAQYDPAGATANTAAPGAGGDSNPLGKLGQGAVDSVTKNPLGLALGAGGLAYNIEQQKALKKELGGNATQNLSTQAQQQGATAQQLSQYALTGTVPAGNQAAIDQSIAEAKANAISNAAGQGLPTDPTKNSALAATLAKIDAQGPILAAQIAQNLLQSGASFAGLSDQLYGQLAQIDQTQRASMGKAIANLAAALNTGGGTKIQIGGSGSQ